MTVLVTAANGNQGKLLVPRLVANGVAVRASVRSERSAQALRTAGVEDVVVGDLSEPDILHRAMDGVAEVYYVGPALHPAERATGLAAIAAAQAFGVRHFVFSSVLHSIITDLVQHQIKRDVEENLISSGLQYTILQPANYMLRHRLVPAFEHGVFRLSWALDRSQSMVDVGDVAQVAAAVLSDRDRHAGATYELVAPGRYTAYEIATVISSKIGRDVQAELIDPSSFLQTALGVDDLSGHQYQLSTLQAICAYYGAHDFVGSPNVLAWLLERPATTFAQFVAREFDAFQRHSERR